MKTNLLKSTLFSSAAAFALMLAPSVHAQLYGYEGFDYGIGYTVGGGNGGIGWAAAWASGSGAWMGTNYAGSLSYKDSMGNWLATSAGKLGVGSPVVPNSTTASPNRALFNASATYTNLGHMAANNLSEPGTVWVSLLYQRPTQAANPYYRQANLGLFQGTSEKFAVGAPNTSATVVNNTLSLWSSGGTHPGSAPLQSTVPVFSATDHFIVMKISVDLFSAALTKDSVYAWFNPADITVTPNTALADLNSGPEVDLSGITTFRLQAGNKNSNADNSFFYGDELRIGFTAADVMPVPEPSAICLLGFGLLGALLRFRRD
jgi:hypothetical protein